MKTIKINYLRFLNFKSFRDKRIEFSDNTEICGRNATGKTTVFDGFMWCLFGKDSTDRKQFNVKTLDADGNAIPKLPHEVEAGIDEFIEPIKNRNMKKLIVILMLALPLAATAQDLVHFALTPDGTYLTEDGKDFAVVPFDNKNAHQIYQELATNVGLTYRDPSKVMSGVEDASIKIRAYSDDIICDRPFGGIKMLPMGGYYQLEFRIKDGRVRVSAPIIEEEVRHYGSSISSNFFRVVKKYFKNGKLKDDKRKVYYDIVVREMNSIINRILNSTNVQDENNDW